MKVLTQDEKEVIEAIKGSKIVEISKDQTQIKKINISKYYLRNSLIQTEL